MSSRSSLVAADERRLEAVGSLRPAALGDDPQARHAGTGAALPLSTLLAGRLEGDRPLPRRAGSPRRPARCPGAATDCSRAAVLTRSPATMPWSVAPMVTAASPVSTPARAWTVAGLAPSARTASTSSSAGADGALGVVLVGGRRAPDGHHGVADELLDRAAVALDDLARQLEVACQQLADVLRVAVLGERREADEVGEQDRDEPPFSDRGRRSPDAVACGSPVGVRARRAERSAALATEPRSWVVGRIAPGARDAQAHPA